MKYNFEAAIFDMDGTLLESMRYWRLTTLEYILKHDLPLTEDICANFLYISSRTLVYKICRENNVTPDMDAVVREVEAYMERHYQHDIRMKPDVPQFLELLKSKGIKMCVATAVSREIAIRALEKNGIMHYFDFVTGLNDFGHHKGEAEYFHTIAGRLGTEPNRCMVFEDALYAMKGAKAAGCDVCAIEDITAMLQKEEILSTCDIYIQNYAQLLN